jgi:hypothetical protein
MPVMRLTARKLTVRARCAVPCYRPRQRYRPAIATGCAGCRREHRRVHHRGVRPHAHVPARAGTRCVLATRRAALQRVATCRNVLRCVATCRVASWQCVALRCNVSQRVALRCNVSRCVGNVSRRAARCRVARGSQSRLHSSRPGAWHRATVCDGCNRVCDGCNRVCDGCNRVCDGCNGRVCDGCNGRVQLDMHAIEKLQLRVNAFTVRRSIIQVLPAVRSRRRLAAE